MLAVWVFPFPSMLADDWDDTLLGSHRLGTIPFMFLAGEVSFIKCCIAKHVGVCLLNALLISVASEASHLLSG